MAASGDLNGNAFKVDPSTGFLTPTNQHALTGFTADAKVFFLDKLRIQFHIGRACKAAGIDRQTYLNAIEIDRKFAKEFAEIRDMHLDDLENSLFDAGKSDAPKSYVPAIFLLKSWRRDRYGERTTIEHKSNADGTDEMFNAIIARRIERGTMIEIETTDDASPPSGNASPPPPSKESA